MGKNKFENFVFSIICCFFMVTGMTFYNAILESGLKINISETLIIFIPVFIIAFVIDWFIVARIAKFFVGKLTNENDPIIKKILLISTFMVFGMASCMSLISILVKHHGEGNFLSTYAHTLGLNLMCALPLQLIFVGPVARLIFFKIFPIDKPLTQKV